MAAKNPWKLATLVLALLLLISFFVPKNLLRPWESTDTATNSVVPALVDTSYDPAVQVAIINDKTCTLCDASNVETGLRTYFPTVQIKTIDVASSAGKSLIKRFNLQTLPSFIFDAAITATANYDKVKSGLIQKEGVYLLNPAMTGAGRLIHNPNVLPDDAAEGSENAPVVMFEFSDFQCPFCKKFFDETYPLLKKDYIDTGKVRLIFRHLPLDIHEFAAQTALAAQCANDQKKFWDYHDVLFAHQSALDVDSLKKYAADLKLDTTQFGDCLNTVKHAQRIAGDIAYATSIGISGTPSFVINRVVISGAQPYEIFKTILDAELKK